MRQSLKGCSQSKDMLFPEDYLLLSANGTAMWI